MPIVATAAWSIPKSVAHRFPAEGSGLSRYAAVFTGVEVNSTFYRRHKTSTFARWAETVPDDFRFAVKMPREITHVQRLRDIGPAFATFLSDIAPLNGKLGPLLCQLPPSLPFEPATAGRALETMHMAHDGGVVIEARHKSWAAPAALALLANYSMERVLADPAPVWLKEDFTEPPRYMRLHGAPEIYYSRYDEAEIRVFAKLLGPESWCVFDNTAAGAACENALTLLDMLQGG